MFTRYFKKRLQAIYVYCRTNEEIDSAMFSLSECKLKRKCRHKWGDGHLRETAPQRFEWVRA